MTESRKSLEDAERTSICGRYNFIIAITRHGSRAVTGCTWAAPSQGIVSSYLKFPQIRFASRWVNVTGWTAHQVSQGQLILNHSPGTS